MTLNRSCLLTCAVLVLGVSDVRAAKPVVIAEYWPGHSRWCGWQARIDAQGRVRWSAEESGEGKGCPAISPGRLRRVRADGQVPLPALERFLAAADAVGFHAMERGYSLADHDCPGQPNVFGGISSRKLTLRRGSKNHSVEVEGWATIVDPPIPPCQPSDPDAVRRFMRIWAELLEMASPPNPDQTPSRIIEVLHQ